MNFANLPLLIILVISVIGNNPSVALAAVALLALKLLGLNSAMAFVEAKGINIGVTILTAAVLVPLASGRIDTSSILNIVKSPVGLIALLTGTAVAWIAGQGVTFMKASPEIVTALMVGTLVGVCFLRGLAVGPLIAGGVVALLVGALKI
jgi:uncharacterized membrane protein (DUF441 family)